MAPTKLKGSIIMDVHNSNNVVDSYYSSNHHNTSGEVKPNDFANVMASVEEDTDMSLESSKSPSMDTNQGHQSMDLDEYFSPNTHSKAPINLLDLPLLLPTAHNVDTLSKYSEGKFKDLLSEYNIPSPPTSIEFDAEGKLVLPKDYPYASELKQAFDEHPEVEKALSTTAALASHYAGIMEGAGFRDEMSTARSQAEQDRSVQKYSYLFDDSRPATQIILAFAEDGSMLVGQSKV